jgi:hypothetical protein
VTERSKRSFIPVLVGAAGLFGLAADSKSPNPRPALELQVTGVGCVDVLDTGGELKKSPPALAFDVCTAAGVDF